MNAIANELLTAWDAGHTVPSIAARVPAFNWADAYAISAALIKLRRARGEKTVGRKIGFTNRNIWPQYGATSPIWHPAPSTPDELRRYMIEESSRWAKTIKAAGIRIE